jgi:hypothetical protein
MEQAIIATDEGIRVTDNDEILTSVLASLMKRNSFMPNVERIIYNDPVIKVYFVDGTWVLLKTTHGDTFDKERGLVYALVKRMMGTPDPVTHEVKGGGYMGALHRMIDSATDQKKNREEKEKAAAEKKEKKEKKEKGKPDAAPVEKKQKEASLRDRVNELSSLLKDIKESLHKGV